MENSLSFNRGRSKKNYGWLITISKLWGFLIQGLRVTLTLTLTLGVQGRHSLRYL